MGQVIYLEQRRTQQPRPSLEMPPAFFFDVSCPMSYLTAERVERTLGAVEWVAVDGAALRRHDGGPADAECDHAAREIALRERAAARAQAMRLPLVWPDQYPSPARCAQRASAFACEIGAGAAFALAASRLAFCGGFDLDDPETLAEAAAAAGIPLEDCLAAAGETWRDEELEAAAEILRAQGIRELPAIRVGRQWCDGDNALLAAAALLSDRGLGHRRLAPVG
jgi:2-hydroxychromene-2-carboxylate isomerase